MRAEEVKQVLGLKDDNDLMVLMNSGKLKFRQRGTGYEFDAMSVVQLAKTGVSSVVSRPNYASAARRVINSGNSSGCHSTRISSGCHTTRSSSGCHHTSGGCH